MSGDLADDLLRGARCIAGYVFKNEDKRHQRKVYHQHEKTLRGSGAWPLWKDGPDIISRKTLLNEHFKGPIQKSAV